MTSTQSYVLVENSKSQFVGISTSFIKSLRDTVVLTQQGNGVYLYQYADRKVLNSWLVSPRSVFSCAAVQDSTGKRYFAALDGNHLHSWTKDAKEMIQSSPKFSFPSGKKIFKLLTDGMNPTSGVFVVLEDCSLSSFSSSLKEESKLNHLSSRSAVWTTLVQSSDIPFRCILLVHKNNEKGNVDYRLEILSVSESFQISQLGNGPLSSPSPKETIISVTLTAELKLSVLWSSGTLQVLELNLNSWGEKVKSETEKGGENNKSENKENNKEAKQNSENKSFAIISSVPLNSLVLPRPAAPTEAQKTVTTTSIGKSSIVVVANQSQDHSQRSLSIVDSNYGVGLTAAQEMPLLNQFHFQDVLSIPSNGTIIWVGTNSVVVSQLPVQSSSLADTLSLALSASKDESASFPPASKVQHDLQKWIKESLRGSNQKNLEEDSVRKEVLTKEIEESNRKEESLVESLSRAKSENDFLEKKDSYKGTPSLYFLQNVVELAIDKKYFKALSAVIQANQIQSTTSHPRLIPLLVESKKTSILEEVVLSKMDIKVDDLLPLLKYFTSEGREQSATLARVLEIPLANSFQTGIAKSLPVANSIILFDYIEKSIVNHAKQFKENDEEEGGGLELKSGVSWLNAITDAHFTEFVLNKDSHASIEKLKASSSSLLLGLKQAEDLAGKLQVILEKNTLPKENSSYSVIAFRLEDARSLQQLRGLPSKEE